MKSERPRPWRALWTHIKIMDFIPKVMGRRCCKALNTEVFDSEFHLHKVTFKHSQALPHTGSAHPKPCLSGEPQAELLVDRGLGLTKRPFSHVDGEGFLGCVFVYLYVCRRGIRGDF